VFCPYAVEVWHVHLLSKLFSTPKSQVLNFLARSNVREAVTLAIMVWHIWEAHNGVRNEERRKHPSSLAEQKKVYIKLILLHLFKSPTDHRREASSSPTYWSPPPAVINIDAALFSSSSRMGARVVIRDHDGKFLTACSNEVTVLEIAEALAIRSAVSLVKEECLIYSSWCRIASRSSNGFFLQSMIDR
jgi:hypothetical protein